MTDATGRQPELEALHAARLHTIEEKQRNAEKWLRVLIGQVRLLRETLGLPPEIPDPAEEAET